MARSAARLSMVPRIARFAGVSGLVLGLAGALATPAAAAGPPGPGGPVSHQPGLVPRQPGLALPRGLAQPGFPGGLWRPGATGSGTWRPALTPAASTVAPADGPTAAPPGGPTAAPAGGPAAASSSWRAQQTPNPVIRNGVLDAISCASPGTCLAVGGYENRAGTGLPLAEARTSTGWRVQPAPAPPGAVFSNLFGVSCTAADACTAAGYYTDGLRHIHPLAERWDGRSWRIQAAPSPLGRPLSGFFAVSCTSATACTAVGAQTDATGTTALAERWDGTSWRVQATPSPAGSAVAEFFAVSCTSANACTAGGASLDNSGTSVPLAERWDGTSWRVQVTPAPAGSIGSGFAGMSCSSATVCIAAGSYGTSGGSGVMLAERWNGTRWRIQVTPSPAGATGSELLAVSCAATGACTAVGSVTIGSAGGRAATTASRNSGGSTTTVELAERWNGTTWRVQAIPNPGRSTGTGFAAVSCSTPTACTAGGSYDTASHLGRPVAAGWGGRSWHRQAVPARVGASVASGLVGVSCASARTCIAVGYGTATTGESTTLAERWDGSRWRIQRSPVPAGTVSAGLSGVSCPSPRTCTAVGQFFNSGQRELPLAERWDGTRWRIQPVPSPAGARRGAELSAVSCPSADRCFAVGQYFTKSGSVALGETWKGGRWTVQPLPGAVTNTYLLGVTCVTPRACVAVGSYGTEIWNGTSWRFVPMATPTGGQVISLNGVSCTSASACTAVGSYFTRNAGPLNLAETWNGTAWRVQATPNPMAQGRNQINSVSCTSPRACTAVGVDAASDFSPPGGFAEAWDGTRWRLQATPFPPGTVLAELFTVSCAVPGACTVVGTVAGQSMIMVTLALRTG